MLEVEDIGEVAYEANKALRKCLGEGRHPVWNQIPKWKREMVCEGVRRVIRRRGKITPKEMHFQWMEAMKAEGWVFGFDFDEDAQTHPNMVPFSELCPEQQAKDEMFLAVVTALMPLCQED